MTVAIVFLAAMVRSTLGFGEALVAVPLLALVMPVTQAAPLMVLVSITIAAMVLWQDWRHVHFQSAWRLIIATFAGIPVGLWFLRALPEATVKMALALVILAFSIYSISGRTLRHLTGDGLAWLFGFCAGVLGGAYGMNGPPLAIYGSLRRWEPAYFRATLQAYFLPAGIVGMAGYWLAGFWTPAVTESYLQSLPGVVLAVFAGRMIRVRNFAVVVHSALILIGAVLLIQSWR
ncbi:MAG: sulfite exporter TauE/SafE family protein [Acidobacteria bacterium]|nr:sulfite exporter TauE/SafE family protein [Acidobacteriota bacterium]